MSDRITRAWVARQMATAGASTAELLQWATEYDPRGRDVPTQVHRALAWLEGTSRAQFHRGRWTLTPAGREFAGADALAGKGATL